MGMIKAILWDIDGTLLNFAESEKYAVRHNFSVFGLGECTDEMLADYSSINVKYWEMLERGEMGKQDILVGRFREFFIKYGIDEAVAVEFNKAFQLSVGDAIYYNKNGYEIINALKGRALQYAVTNGTKVAQRKKLSASGMEQIFDGVFISDEVGFEKPQMEFFDAVFSELHGMGKDEIMIVGDSLTSDIRGGNNAGIICCYYNPMHIKKEHGLRIDYEIDDLMQVIDCMGLE